MADAAGGVPADSEAGLEALARRVERLELLGPKWPEPTASTAGGNDRDGLLAAENAALRAEADKLRFRVQFLLRALDKRDLREAELLERCKPCPRCKP